MYTLIRAFSKSARRRQVNLKVACAVTTVVACTYAVDTQESPRHVAHSAGLGLPRMFAFPSGSNVANASPQKEKLKVSIHAARGPRATMEDRWFVSDDLRFFAVYDGHGGHRVAEQAQKMLYDEFVQQLEDSSPTPESAEGEEPQDAIIRTANDPQIVQKALQKGIEQVSRKVLSTTYLDLEGSTAVIVYLCDKVIVTANLGDSRAILCRGNKAVSLTVDHKPDGAREKKRIEDLGGRVKWHGYLGPDKLPVPGMGAYRINGNLAVSRALGDRLERPYLSSDPDLAVLERNQEEDRYLVIASDGLWDVMTSQDVVDFVKQISLGAPTSAAGLPQSVRGKKGGSTVTPMELPASLLQQGMASLGAGKGSEASIRAELDKRKASMAQFIVEEALRRGSADNVTVLVVWLR